MTVKNGYATKSQVLIWIGITVATMVGAGWAFHQQHTSHAHYQAVTKEDFRHFLANEREWREELRNSIKTIEEQLRELSR